MAYGFEIRNSAGAVELDTSSIGIQVIHEVTLTAVDTDVTWVSKHAPFYFAHFSMKASGEQQSLSWVDITPANAPVNSYTYTFTIQYGKTFGNHRLAILGGDAYTVTDDGSTDVGGTAGGY